MKTETLEVFFSVIVISFLAFVCSCTAVAYHQQQLDHLKGLCVRTVFNDAEKLSTGIGHFAMFDSNEPKTIQDVSDRLNYVQEQQNNTNKEVNQLKDFLSCYFDEVK